MTAAAKKDDKKDAPKAASKQATEERDYKGELVSAHTALATIRKIVTERASIDSTVVVEAITRNNVNTEDFDQLAAGV
jgi:hypothetical protein